MAQEGRNGAGLTSPDQESYHRFIEAGETVYVVEDEAIIALEIEERLRDAGIDVCGSCADPEVAFEEILRFKPSLVLMDVNLGSKVDGIELAARCRSVLPVKVVFLTAYADVKMMYPEIVGERVLGKPFDTRSLLSAVGAALSSHDVTA